MKKNIEQKGSEKVNQRIGGEVQQTRQLKKENRIYMSVRSNESERIASVKSLIIMFKAFFESLGSSMVRGESTIGHWYNADASAEANEGEQNRADVVSREQPVKCKTRSQHKKLVKK